MIVLSAICGWSGEGLAQPGPRSRSTPPGSPPTVPPASSDGTGDTPRTTPELLGRVVPRRAGARDPGHAVKHRRWSSTEQPSGARTAPRNGSKNAHSASDIEPRAIAASPPARRGIGARQAGEPFRRHGRMGRPVRAGGRCPAGPRRGPPGRPSSPRSKAAGAATATRTDRREAPARAGTRAASPGRHGAPAGGASWGEVAARGLRPVSRAAAWTRDPARASRAGGLRPPATPGGCRRGPRTRRACRSRRSRHGP